MTETASEILILSSKTCPGGTGWGIVCVIVAVLMLAVLISAWRDGDDDGTSLLAGIGIVVFTLLAVAAFSRKPHIEVKAYIPDAVPWEEIYKNYEVLNQDGKLWTLRVLEDTNDRNNAKAD